MPSYYGVVFPEFWTGHTGRELRTQGGKDAQILGLYLMTNRHANMIGLYKLLVDDLRHETGLGAKAIERGYAVTGAAQFATFDSGSSYVWVRQMARFRLALKSGDALDPDDKRVTGINRIYHALDGNPFLGDFFDTNHKSLKLRKRRDGSGLVVSFTATTTYRDLQGASKGLVSQVTESGIRIRDQKRAVAAPREPAENVRVITALVHSVISENGMQPFADLKEATKAACAKHQIAYDAEAVGAALESALAQRPA